MQGTWAITQRVDNIRSELGLTMVSTVVKSSRGQDGHWEPFCTNPEGFKGLPEGQWGSKDVEVLLGLIPHNLSIQMQARRAIFGITGCISKVV